MASAVNYLQSASDFTIKTLITGRGVVIEGNPDVYLTSADGPKYLDRTCSVSRNW
jgi:hypothetical protein